MEKIKSKLINENKPETSITENNLFQNIFQNNNIAKTKNKEDNISVSKTSNFNITSVYFNKNKHNNFNSKHPKF